MNEVAESLNNAGKTVSVAPMMDKAETAEKSMA
jgi:hypothetical protein